MNNNYYILCNKFIPKNKLWNKILKRFGFNNFVRNIEYGFSDSVSYKELIESTIFTIFSDAMKNRKVENTNDFENYQLWSLYHKYISIKIQIINLQKDYCDIACITGWYDVCLAYLDTEMTNILCNIIKLRNINKLTGDFYMCVGLPSYSKSEYNLSKSTYKVENGYEELPTNVPYDFCEL